MLKWKIAALVGILFGVAGVGWGYAQQRQAPGFYELRIYKTLPGKRDALAARFASRTAAIYARHGITNVGYWIPQESDTELGIDAAIFHFSMSLLLCHRSGFTHAKFSAASVLPRPDHRATCG